MSGLRRDVFPARAGMDRRSLLDRGRPVGVPRAGGDGRRLRVEAARRWWTDDPLTRQWDRVDEAIIATRRTRA